MQYAYSRSIPGNLTSAKLFNNRNTVNVVYKENGRRKKIIVYFYILYCGRVDGSWI